MIVGYSRASTVSPGDPDWSDVVLLMGFEGANGATGAPGMNDESPSAHGTAINGTTFSNISTTQKKFGNSSLHLQGDSIWFTDSTDWALGSGHFTVEMWVYPVSVGSLQYLVCQFGQIAPNLGWVFYLNTSGTLGWNVSTTGTNNFTDITSSTTLSNNTWYHVCVDYDGTKYRMYINGTMVGSSTTARSIYHPTGQNLAIGSNSNQSGWEFDGYIDEVRITKGVARYASDSGFSVPGSAFPRHS